MKTTSKKIDTQCVRGGIEDYEFGPVTPPIYQTSTFRFKSAQNGADLFSGKEKGFIYSRMGNPTVEAMENSIADLECGIKALGCSSGMAAVNTVLTSLLKSGDNVVCSKAVYGPTNTLLNNVFKKFGVTVTFVDTSSIEEIKTAFKPETKVLYIETPGNPTLDICDLKETSDYAHRHNVKVVVDNTFMSPVLQKPLNLGADIVLHSMTKFLNGHADVVAGIIVFKFEEDYSQHRKVLNQLGGVIDPFNAFLVHRGVKTLNIRMQRHCENAMKVAEFLERNDLIEWVRYPGLKSHPHYLKAQKQQSGNGGVISFELKGGLKAGEILMNSLKFAILAVSLGGVETLIQHPASMTHFSMGKEARLEAGITDGLVRLSVGIEDVNDIIDDLEQGLEKIRNMR